MCLDNVPEEVKKFKSKHKNHTTVTVYKRMVNSKLIYDSMKATGYREVTGLFPCYRKSYEYEAGWNVSNSRRLAASLKREQISNGMHAYTSLARAKECLDEYDGEILVKFTANVKDVIGVDEDGVAVFKKLYLTEGEYKRAMKVK